MTHSQMVAAVDDLDLLPHLLGHIPEPVMDLLEGLLSRRDAAADEVARWLRETVA